MRSAVYCLIIFVCLSFDSTSVWAYLIEDEHVRLSVLTSNEGLPQNTVDCILKDSKGFIWFGTWNGLCRHDGFSFKIFQKQNDEYVVGNMVQALCEDSAGNIWVGTENGLAYFDYSSFRFVPLQSLNAQLDYSSITSIATDAYGNAWVGTESNGVWKIRTEMDGSFSVELVYSKLLPSQSVNHLHLETGKHLFVGTDLGLAIVDVNTEQALNDYALLEGEIGSVSVEVVHIDSHDNIWVGCSDVGLYHMNTKISNINYFGASIDNPCDLNHLMVRDIDEDANGQIIIATLGGVNFFNKSTNTFSTFSSQIELSSPFVNSLCTDADGNIWLGTEKGGVDFYNIHQKPFYSIKHERSNTRTISHNTINSLYVEGDVLWIGTAGGGLNKVSNGGVKTYRFNSENSRSLNNDFVTSVYRDAYENLWVGTWGGGLNYMSKQMPGDFISFVNDPNNETTICNSFVSCVEPLNSEQLLVGTGAGIDILNLNNKTFTHTQSSLNIEESLAVGCMLVDKSERLWVGTRNGLYRLNTNDLTSQSLSNKNISIKRFVHNSEDQNTLPGNYIISLFESTDGTLWIGTYGNGICRVQEDWRGISFENFNEEHGLCNNVAYCIEEDTNKNLWISTDNGLSKFVPNTHKFQNFYENDGLQSNQFYWSASSHDADGKLYFGGINGVNYFSPQQIELNNESNTPVFTEFSIYSTPVEIGKEYHSKVVIDKPISQCPHVQLSYKDAVFSIEFSSLDYFLPQKSRYAYKMEGVDQDWVEVNSTRRFANYTNLSGGDYTFLVRSTNSDGVWSNEPAVLKLTVTPPVWEMLWFQLLLVVVGILLMWLYIRSRTNFLKEQQRKLEALVQERTCQVEKQNKELAQQRDELVVLNEKVKLVNQLRLRFFTNISHEFRTPLTLIIDPLEHLLKQWSGDDSTRQTLGMMNRNAQRLLNLINQLLYFRKVETGKLTLNVSKGNLTLYLRDIFASFQNLAQHKNIDYQFRSSKTVEDCWFDAEKISNIVYNLLSNAFKHTHLGGSVFLHVDYDNHSRHVFITVVDTGCGISENNLPHIFDRFYKARETEADAEFSSSGIGLALTYELVKALHGEISVQSKVDEGSRFVVEIPFEKESFNVEELSENSAPADIFIEGRVSALTEQIVLSSEKKCVDINAEHDKMKPLLLIAEDNFDLRSFLLNTLAADYRVVGAENGKVALSLAKKYSPDLIISDVMMPEMDGIEFCSKVKSNIKTSHIPVILLTAKDVLESWIEGLETGADDYIPKPFNLKILQIKISNLIESRKKIKRMFSSPELVSSENVTTNKIDEAFVAKAYDILKQNYKEPDFTVDQFAKEMLVSRSLLYKKMKDLTGMNVTNFINSYRLKKAVELIKNNDYSISEVAYLTGFNDPKYFSRIFKKFYGSRPSDFIVK